MGSVLLLIAAAAFLPLGCYIVSPTNPVTMFWYDEILSYTFLTDPSWSHMLHALAGSINASPPLYFIVGRLWVRVFGASELALRMFSSAGFAAAFVLLGDLLRRTFGIVAALLAAAVVFCTCDSVLIHNAEARFYGMLVAEIAGLFWVYGRIMAAQKPSGILWAAQSVLCAALVMTHYMGLPVLAFIATAYALVQLRHRRFDWRPFVSILVGGAAFLMWWPVFLRHRAIPTSWVHVPSLEDLASAMSGIFRDALVLLLVLLVARWALRRSADEPPPRRETEPLLILAGVYAMFPVALWVYSRLRSPLFVERYYFHAFLAAAIPLAHFSCGVLRDAGRRVRLRAVSLAGAVLVMVGAVGLFLYACSASAGAYWGNPVLLLGPVGHGQMPVAFDNITSFMTSARYSTEGQRYVFLLDPADGAQYPSTRGLHEEYPELNMAETDTFLAEHGDFLLFSETDPPWLARHVQGDPGYVCTLLSGSGPGELRLIRRVGRR